MSKLAPVLAVIVTVVLVAVWAQSQQQGRPYASATKCRHNVAVTESIFGFNSRDSTEITAHEAVHRRQLAEGCDSILELWSRDHSAKMDAEAEALCVGMRAAGLTPSQRTARAVQAAQWWSQYAGGESFAEYLARFNSWCG